MMNINDMIKTTRDHAIATGEVCDPFFGEFKSVLKLMAAYYGGFNIASDMSNYNSLRD